MHCIRIDYHKLVDGKTKDERIASLKEVGTGQPPRKVSLMKNPVSNLLQHA